MPYMTFFYYVFIVSITLYPSPQISHPYQKRFIRQPALKPTNLVKLVLLRQKSTAR